MPTSRPAPFKVVSGRSKWLPVCRTAGPLKKPGQASGPARAVECVCVCVEGGWQLTWHLPPLPPGPASDQSQNATAQWTGSSVRLGEPGSACCGSLQTPPWGVSGSRLWALGGAGPRAVGAAATPGWHNARKITPLEVGALLSLSDRGQQWPPLPGRGRGEGWLAGGRAGARRTQAQAASGGLQLEVGKQEPVRGRPLPRFPGPWEVQGGAGRKEEPGAWALAIPEPRAGGPLLAVPASCQWICTT